MGTLGGSRTRINLVLNQARLPVAARAYGASGRPRTACLLRTKETLYQMSYRGIAPGAGVEPTSPGSGPGILPLNDPGSGAEGAIRTHMPRGLSLRGMPRFPSLPHGAPPGTRTPTETQVKSLP